MTTLFRNMCISEASRSFTAAAAATTTTTRRDSPSSSSSLPSIQSSSIHQLHPSQPLFPHPSLQPYLYFLESHYLSSPTLPSATAMPPSAPQIAIIGAGPAGLTLAAILQRHSIPYTLYDADPSPSARNQGGTLDLHPQGGQAALRDAGLWEEFARRARPESDVLKVVRNDGAVLWDGNVGVDRALMEEKKKKKLAVGGKGFEGRPEIDRGVLREILLGPVEGGVKWGKKLVEVVPPQLPGAEEVGKWELRFADGGAEGGFDLVVGADGAWSRVRRVLSDETPHYSGVVCVEVWALKVRERHAWMVGYVGEGSCFSFGEGRTIQMQRIGDGSIRTYACLRRLGEEEFLEECGIDWSRPDMARREFVERFFGDCGVELQRMVVESDDGLVPRTLYQLPVGFEWESRPGVTLLGDAAHLMTPFAGVGVNVAMADAMELGKAIVGFVESARGSDLVGSHMVGDRDSADGKSLSEVVKEYEAGLFLRGETFAAKTIVNMKKHFSATGSEELVARLRAGYRSTN